MSDVWYYWECHGCGAGPCRAARMDEEEPTQCLYLPHSITWTRLPDTPEERSCETCGGTGELIELYPHGIKERHDCPNCRPSNPKPTPHAPQDALARARRLSECSVKDEVIAYYESAIAEEQARTKDEKEKNLILVTEIETIRRCQNMAEARYGVAEADRNHEIERREEAERKLADAWTEDDVGVAMWHCWDILQGQDVMDSAGFISKVNDWLASRRKERKG
jgi:hypothetical protein